MAPQKVADAANNAPYLTHLVTHHGQTTLIPPDNAGRIRQQPKKQRSRKPERNVRQEEDLRFNTGPKFCKITPMSSRTNERRNRSHRTNAREEVQNSIADDGIPDYPPPSFAEAMSSPSISLTPSTATVTHNHFRQPTISSPLALPAPQPEPATSMPDTSASDSDNDSLLQIDSSGGTSSSSPGMVDGRGRSPSRSRVLIDPDEDEEWTGPSPVTPTSDQRRRRQLSLSPLRTFLTPKPSTLPQRALSAHPYSQSRNPSSFFSRSTTSLATLTFGRSPSSPTFSTADSKGDRHKGKQKATEPLDSWEIIDSDDAVADIDSPPQSPPLESQSTQAHQNSPQHPSQHSPQYPSQHSPQYPSQHSPQYPSQHSPQYPSQHSPQHPSQHPTQPQIKPMPLIDKKAPFPVMKKEAKRRGTTPAAVITASPVIAPPSGPIIINVRVRRPEASPAQRTPAGPSPLGSEPRIPSSTTLETSVSMLQKAINTPLPLTPVEKPAIELPNREHVVPATPLPVAVAQSSDAGLFTRTDSSDLSRSPSPDSCTCRHGGSPVPASRDITSDPRTLDYSSRPAMQPISTSHPNFSIPSTPCTPGAYMTPASNSPTHTSTQIYFDSHADRHHYSGRPLPRPPPSVHTPSTRTMMVDSTYAPSDMQGSPSSSSSVCPEGLLIDLDEPAKESNSSPASPTFATPRASLLLSSEPLIDMSGAQTHPTTFTTVNRAQTASPSPSRTIASTDESETETEARYATRNLASSREITTFRSPSSGPPSRHEPAGDATRQAIDDIYSHITDLDLLVAGFNDSDLRNGSGYDALLRVSEIIGPAVPETFASESPRGNGTLVLSTHVEPKRPASPVPLLGQVSVDRRRVTKDGRVKVKLLLLESAVDKCGICFSQFKEGDLAAMSNRLSVHSIGKQDAQSHPLMGCHMDSGYISGQFEDHRYAALGNGLGTDYSVAPINYEQRQ
uniref:Uncharacterized protein n=1 Tax=Moniliophthora roreri TaxID=221103 RepID=A0A0W0GAE7_MONRR